MKYVFLISAILFFSCSAKKNVGYTTLLENFETVRGLDQPMLISSNKELQKFYIKLNKTRMPALKIPEVDFTSQRLLVLPYIIKKVDKNTLEIEKMYVEKNILNINIKEVKKSDQANLIHPRQLLIFKVDGIYDQVKVNTLK